MSLTRNQTLLAERHHQNARSQAHAWERTVLEAPPPASSVRSWRRQAEPAIHWVPRQSLGTSWWRLARSVRILLIFGVASFGLQSSATHAHAQVDEQVIRTIAEIHRVPPEDLSKAIPVDLECIVMCYEPEWPILFVSDGRDGLYVGNPRELSIKRGDRIRLRGVLGENRHPINCTYEASDNNIDFPKPKLVEFDWLQSGKEDSQLVEIEGQFVAIDVERYETCLEMRTSNNGHFRGLLHSSKVNAKFLRTILGKKLRLRGVVGARFDEFQRWSGFQIWLGEVTDIVELENPGEPIELPLTPIGQLKEETIAESNTCFFRTAGVVAYRLSPSMVLLQDETHQVFVELQIPRVVSIDNAYDITGSLDTGVDPPVLRMAVAVPSAQKFTIARTPNFQTVEELIDGDFSGQFVRTVGTYSGTFDLKDQHGFLLKVNSNILPVFLEEGDLRNVAIGTPIEAEGIWIQQKSLVGFNIGSCALHSRFSGVRIGSQTPWFPIGVLAAAGATALASSVWAVTLRRQVRRRTQQFLDSVSEQRRTEEQYADVFINAHVMVMTTGENGKITAVNPATMRTTQREEIHLIGLHVTELVDVESKKTLSDLLHAALNSEKTVSCHVKLIASHSAAIPQEVSCWVAQSDGNRHLHLIWHDISERLRIEQQRAEMEQRMLSMQKMESLGVLAGGIAHDFNNLLTVIIGNASLLSVSPKLSADDLENVDSIEQASARAAELTQQMLAYTGRGQFDIRVLDISVLVSEMSQLLAASVSKSTQLKFVLPEKLPGVKADATQLKQILMNLVRNASEAMVGRTGAIRIRTFAASQMTDTEPNSYTVNFLESPTSNDSPNFICMEVSDEGSGIDEANMKSIFDPFFSTKFSGRGLGLSTVLGIVRAHHGCLQVHSQVGLGTTFRIYLTSCKESVASIPSPHFFNNRIDKPAHVMIVDDEPGVLQVLARTLQTAGLQVTQCNGGEEALKALESASFEVDCLITDQTMPKMSGLELCESIHRTGRAIPIILGSGYSMDLDSTLPKTHGVRAFIQKPYQRAELIDQVLRIIDEQRGKPQPTA